MRRWLLIVPFLLCCSHAFAQTSTGLFKSDLKAQYELSKQAMTALYQRLQPKLGVFENEYSLFQCSMAGNFLGTSPDVSWADDRTMRATADLAYKVVWWSNDLRRLGYPANVWSDLLARFEAEQIALLARPGDWSARDQRDRAFLGRLAGALNAYRNTKPALPRAIVGEDCGAGDVAVSIVTEPRGGKVLFTPGFYYELCRAQRLDPEDPARCNRWREALDGKLEYVAGDYYYIARWSDGAVRRGSLRIDANDDGRTITLRKP